MPRLWSRTSPLPSPPSNYLVSQSYSCCDSYSINMASNQQTSSHQARSSRATSSTPTHDTTGSKSDEWSEVEDLHERRRIQNKLAQRRYRDKRREEKEEAERNADNQRRAGSSYAAPEPGDLEQNRNLSGLPWGGISMKHIVEAGKTKEQNSQRSSQESSTYASASRTGGSSR